MPIRSFSCGYSFNFLLISIAHRTGASGLSKKTSAIPSPTGSRISFPASLALRTCSVPRTISVSCSMVLALLIEKQRRITDQIHKQNVANL